MKISLILALFILSFSNCTSENEKVSNEKINYAKNAKINADKILFSHQFDSFINGKKFLSKNENSEYVITQDKLKELLDLTNFSEEEKAKVTVEFTNNIIKTIVEAKKNRGITKGFISSFPISEPSEKTIIKMLDENKIQEVESLISFNTIPVEEQGMLSVVNDFRNDYLTENKNGLEYRDCFMSGPTGSGYMSCGTAGGIIGGLIGGSCCGVVGLGVGAGVGYLVGKLIGDVS